MNFKFIRRIAEPIIKFLGKISWKPKNLISDADKDVIRQLLIKDYYIILSRRNNHFSTYLISFGHFILTGKWGYWSHVFMNTEDEVNSDSDFRIIEALSTGVRYSPFSEVFNVNSVAILKPKHMSMDDWTTALSNANLYLGRPYDNILDLANDNEINCVELVRNALKTTKDYEKNFAHFEHMISTRKNLTPHMFYECKDFTVVYEKRK